MIDLDGDGKPELVWRTNHAVWYPSLVGAWNPRAGLSPSVLFVNSGTIHGVSGADLGGERRTLVISAINNPLGYQRVVALVEPVHQAGSAYQEGFSPDLFGEWSSAPRNGVVPVRAFTPIGPAGGVALVLAAGPSGIVLDVDRRRIELDADANPRGFPLYGAGSAGRTRFWNELAAACLDLAGGRGDSRAVVAGLRERHAAALAEPPMELALTLMLARSLAQAGNHGAAIDLLQTALAATPDDLDLLLRLGEQLAAVGNYGAAMDALARAHRVNIVGRNPLDAAVSRAELAAASGDEVRFRQVVEYSRASSEGGFRDVESQLLAFWAFCRGEWGAQDLVEEADDHNVPIARGGDAAATARQAQSLAENPEIRNAAELLRAAALVRSGQAGIARGIASGALAALERKARTGIEAQCLVPLAERVNGDAAAALGDTAAAEGHWARALRLAPRCWFGRPPTPSR
jgi:tetratricopeptide (TPR) repeat protein